MANSIKNKENTNFAWDYEACKNLLAKCWMPETFTVLRISLTEET
jgi:hypothetical protein